MADTNFINGTVIEPAWLNDVNDAVYTSLPAVSTDLANFASAVKGAGLVGFRPSLNHAAATLGKHYDSVFGLIKIIHLMQW